MIHEQHVRERAYYIWEDEGRVFGQAESHWFKAEAELLAAQAVAPLTVQPVSEAAAVSPAKALKAAATGTKPKAAKAPAKAAKADAPKNAPTAKRASRRGEAASPAFH